MFTSPARALSFDSYPPLLTTRITTHTTQCPISLSIIEDGVVAADGVTYERAAIEKWFKDGRVTSPMTSAPMEHQRLSPVSGRDRGHKS